MDGRGHTDQKCVYVYVLLLVRTQVFLYCISLKGSVVVEVAFHVNMLLRVETY